MATVTSIARPRTEKEETLRAGSSASHAVVVASVHCTACIKVIDVWRVCVRATALRALVSMYNAVDRRLHQIITKYYLV